MKYPLELFHPGRKVKCISHSDYGKGFRYGEIYTITKSTLSNLGKKKLVHLSIEKDSVGSEKNGWWAYNFEPAGLTETEKVLYGAQDELEN